MIAQIKCLTGVQMRNLFGINEALHSRERRRRIQLSFMAVLYVLLALVVCFYVGAIAYGLIGIGMAELVPLLLATGVGVSVLCFNTLRAGTVIFDLAGYERLIAMPISPAVIVGSRFLTLYCADVALALLMLAPATLVCGARLHPRLSFYPLMLGGALILPLIPMALALLLGGLIHWAAGRMRRHSLIVTLLSMLAVLAVTAASLLLANINEAEVAQLTEIAGQLSGALQAAFPPGAWFARAVAEGEWGLYLRLALLSLAVLALVILGLGSRFQKICERLNARAARKNYVLAGQRRSSVRSALFKRELRRYLTSPLYILNTLSGGAMGVLLSLALLISGQRLAAAEMGLSMEHFALLAPLMLAFMLSISPTTACTISLEGKSFWLAGSLPVEAKEIYGAKLKLHMCFALPCWALSEAFLICALAPRGAQLAWMLLAPLAYLCLGGVAGLWINLHMPMLQWDSERQPVKQSASVGFTVLAGTLGVALGGVLVWFAPQGMRCGAQAVVVCGLLGLSWWLWRGCVRVPLSKIQ